MSHRTRSVFRKAAIALAAAAVLGGCSSTPHPRVITLTFIRHAQSEANADGIIDTTVPGPHLTEDGEGQAQQIAHQLERNHFDGIYASSMIRTQLTAAPLSEEIGRKVEILPGLREIDAGWFNGKPDSMAESTYMVAPTGWVHGDRTCTIPGSIDGNQFNDQFGAAVQTIYDSGDANPVVFSHGEAIMVWTLMNVKNPQDELMTQHPLPNVGRVVITGSPIAGWKLLDWNGIRAFG